MCQDSNIKMQSWAISEEYLWDQLKSKLLVLILDWTFLSNLFICKLSSSWYGMKLNLRPACSSPKSFSSALLFFLCGMRRPWSWGWNTAELQAVPIPTYTLHAKSCPGPSWAAHPCWKGCSPCSPHVLCLPWPATPSAQNLFLISDLLVGSALFHPNNVILEHVWPSQESHSCHCWLVLLIFLCATFFESLVF